MDRFLIFSDVIPWIEAVNHWLTVEISQLRKINAGNKHIRIFLPAGETPRPLYRNWCERGAPFDSSAILVQVDEVISGRQKGMFREFFETELPMFKNQFEWIGNSFENSDIGLLGLGMNGHVAFHEPHLPKDFHSGKVKLDESTCRRLHLESNAQALTYGLGAFMKCKSVALIVRGNSKNKVLDEIRSPQSELPAARLFHCGNTRIFKC